MCNRGGIAEQSRGGPGKPGTRVGRARRQSSANRPAEVRSDLLDSLFARLRKVESPIEAQTVERAIWELWMKSDSPTAELLLTQAVKALGAGEEQASLSILDG